MQLAELLEMAKELPGGDYAECGVWQGYSAEYILARLAPDSTLYLFDSFMGHGKPGIEDDAVAHHQGRYSDTSVEAVQLRCPGAVVIPGWVPESLESVHDKTFRFVHLDMDHYFPIKKAAEFFLPRLVPGGIIRFDDYAYAECPGATLAVDELFPGRGLNYFINGPVPVQAR